MEVEEEEEARLGVQRIPILLVVLARQLRWCTFQSVRRERRAAMLAVGGLRAEAMEVATVEVVTVAVMVASTRR